MMIPITRKEKYINEIAGGGNTAPETPYTREELFFADILGEVVAPFPITRTEKYLAKIANKYSGELPEPVTRIERFLALAAGMNISIPTPVTREEMFWADYALIVEKELSGIPPLTFVSNSENLVDYRIYGASGGVGDKTRNLFDAKNSTYGDGTFWSNAKNLNQNSSYYGSNVIDVTSGETITRSFTGTSANHFMRGNGSMVSVSDAGSRENGVTIIVPDGCIRYVFNIPNSIDPNTIQVVVGSQLPETYEPYGYKIPVVCGGITTNIYLDEPLAKSGNNADYIDYAAQKRHNSDGTESSVTLPEISTLAGTNTLAVGTEVQPSNVYIKYEGAR